MRWRALRCCSRTLQKLLEGDLSVKQTTVYFSTKTVLLCKPACKLKCKIPKHRQNLYIHTVRLGPGPHFFGPTYVNLNMRLEAISKMLQETLVYTPCLFSCMQDLFLGGWHMLRWCSVHA